MVIQKMWWWSNIFSSLPKGHDFHFSSCLCFLINAACTVQGSTNCGIFQSRNEEHGESFGDMENMEKKKRMESINRMSLHTLFVILNTLGMTQKCLCVNQITQKLFIYSNYRDIWKTFGEHDLGSAQNCVKWPRPWRRESRSNVVPWVKVPGDKIKTQKSALPILITIKNVRLAQK